MQPGVVATAALGKVNKSVGAGIKEVYGHLYTPAKVGCTCMTARRHHDLFTSMLACWRSMRTTKDESDGLVRRRRR